MNGKNVLRITLFDFTRAEDGDPIFQQMEYAGDLNDEACMKKIAITAGNHTAGATLTVPLTPFTMIMARLMQSSENRPGIVVPDKGLILPPRLN